MGLNHRHILISVNVFDQLERINKLTIKNITPQEINKLNEDLTERMRDYNLCKMDTSEINKLIDENICPRCKAELQNGGNCPYCIICGFSKC